MIECILLLVVLVVCGEIACQAMINSGHSCRVLRDRTLIGPSTVLPASQLAHCTPIALSMVAATSLAGGAMVIVLHAGVERLCFPMGVQYLLCLGRMGADHWLVLHNSTVGASHIGHWLSTGACGVYSHLIGLVKHVCSHDPSSLGPP